MENENKPIEEKAEEVKEAQTEEKVSPVAALKKMCGKNCQCGEKCCAVWSKNKKMIVAAIILVVVIVGGLALKKYWTEKVDVGQDVIKEKVQNFIKENAPAGVKAEIKEVTKEGVLYKVNLEISAEGAGSPQKVPFYVTRDGKRLTQQVIELDAKKEEAKQPAVTEKTEPEQKMDIPEVDLFVMSYCPYGTQIEKGILPVVKLLGNKIKFNLKFVDYAMHGEKEVNENLRDYCIQKTQPTKLNAYLECFLKKGEGTESACMKTAGVNVAQVNTCVSATDKQFSVKANLADKSKWSNGTYPPFDVDKEAVLKYGVQGSPSLVINGTKVGASRDSASLLKLVCSGFNTQPKECSQTLSVTAPAPGFGEGTTSGASAEANCGN